jgi:hypothetical protein
MALLATPATVRRLLLMRQAGKIDLTPEIIAVADQDRLDESAFDPMVCPYDIIKLTISQFLLDCNLRGAVQSMWHPEFHPLALLNAVRHGADQAVIVTLRRGVWVPAARAVNLPVTILPTTTLGKLDRIDRRTVLIHDVCGTDHHLRNWVREFPRTIIYDYSDVRLVPWIYWARLLFPGMPHPLLPRIIKDVPSNWANLPLAAFALYYNVCIFPHLITAPLLLTLLQDERLIEDLRYDNSALSL